MSKHLTQAEALNKVATHPAAGTIQSMIEHLKEQDKRIAELENKVSRLEKLVDRLDGENSLNRPLI